MDTKNNKPGKGNKSPSDSAALFEKIFKEATQEIHRANTAKPREEQREHAIRPPVQERPRAQKKPSEIEKKPPKPISSTPKQTRIVEETKLRSGKTKPGAAIERTHKGSRALKVSLLVVLVVILTGFVVNYFGIFEVPDVFGLLGFSRKDHTPAPAQLKQPVKASQRALGVSVQKPAAKKAAFPKKDEGEAGALAAGEQAPVSAPKKEEAPAPVQAEKESTKVGSAVPNTPARQREEETGKQAPPPTPQAQTGIQGEVGMKQGQPSTISAASSSAPAAKVSIPHTGASQYPYSIYLGSYKNIDRVRKAIANYQGKGLSPYFARVDLAEKGMWFRVFAGYFKTRGDAEEFIIEKKIPEAETRRTKYAHLIGVYQSQRELETERHALLALGYCPYVIKRDDGNSLLYTGAFSQKIEGEKEQRDLAAKGIQTELAER
jgi:hypothetical protein